MSLEHDDRDTGLDVAVIGMAGRFPGASTLHEFWPCLRDGVEAISRFDEETLASFGIPAHIVRNPQFVNAAPVLAGYDRFDAAFFGYSPSEAELMDPQHRVFLECVWEALEEAGYPPDNCPGLVGVFAGASLSSYLLYHVLPRLRGAHAEEAFQAMIGNDKDFLSTRVSYQLNLRGPSVTVQTGCSTSLVATHLGCQALLAYQCDVALVGGVSIQVPARFGYVYQDGGLQSPDGHCRAFDAQARGTLFGSGVGVVVLKRLADALADRDAIHAVIKGTAVTNDGDRKVGFTAPSVYGQKEAIQRALQFAGVDPRTIGYVECHGTGTALGDPIEIRALTDAFGLDGSSQRCALGSVKTNIGHLDAAAGVAGLIKTILALEHKLLPPSLHFQTPNPQIDFDGGPFFVNSAPRPWEIETGRRRAGVSSFGIGGTNAHAVLEEAPALAEGRDAREWTLFLVSAKSKAARDRQMASLDAYLEREPAADLADAAYTTHVGRSVFEHRAVVVCRDREELQRILRTRDPERFFARVQKPVDRAVVFMFPGGGAQYVGMGAELYRTEPVFRREVDCCADWLQAHGGPDIREHMLGPESSRDAAAASMRRTSIGLPALFAVEYAMARLLMAWGITPSALIGHSLGEYTAACLAGVFSLEDALLLVLTRSRLLTQLPSGSMISVPLSVDELQPWLDGQLSVAAANGPAQTVLSGPADRIAMLIADFDAREIDYRRLQIDVAAHSDVVAPILAPFRTCLDGIRLEPPTIPCISNVTGTWMTARQAVDPGYWVDHLRQTVRFGDGLSTLLEIPHSAFVEVGPGHTLTTICRSIVRETADTVLVNSMRHVYDQQPDGAVLAALLGKLWLANVLPDWQAYHAGQRRWRQHLPGYQFERTRYWLPLPTRSSGDGGFDQPDEKQPEIERWFHVPIWKNLPAPVVHTEEEPATGVRLVFADDGGVAASLTASHVITVVAGRDFRHVGGHTYELDPAEKRHYTRLLQALRDAGQTPRDIVHCWNLAEDDAGEATPDVATRPLRQGFYSVLFLVQAIAECGLSDPIDLWIVTNRAFRVESGDRPIAEHVLPLGLCKVVPQELPHVRCHVIDVDQRSRAALAAAVRDRTAPLVMAYRANRRWVQAFERCPLPQQASGSQGWRPHGTYLLTGGTGGIGLALAEALSRAVQANLVLTGRSWFPRREDWTAWIDQHEDDRISRAIQAIRRMEQQGSEVLVLRADVADATQMASAIDTAVQRFGTIHGAMHLAGITGHAALQLIPDITESTCEPQWRAKLTGARLLARLLADRDLDFVCLFSSTAAVLGGPGLATYAAANAALDACAQHQASRGGTRWVSINWDGWLTSTDASIQSSLDAFAMTLDEGLDALGRVLASGLDEQVIVSTAPLDPRLKRWIETPGSASDEPADEEGESEDHDRPELDTAYVAPQTAIEETIARVWQETLRVSTLGTLDNFFDLGGTSLIALKIVSRLKKELGVDVPLVSMFEAPTIAALARSLSGTPAVDRFEESQQRGAARREQYLANVAGRAN